MKKIRFSILIILLLGGTMAAQNLEDALRYSQNQYKGSSRFMAMGSSFSALGGDLSVLSTNPAGIGVFRSGEFSLTPVLNYTGTEAAYLGTLRDDFKYNLNLNQIGMVSSLPIGQSDGLVRLNFGFAYNRLNDFNSNVIIEGDNNTSSMVDFFAEASEGVYFENLNSYGAGIIFDAWLMDTITGSNGLSYGTIFSNYGDNPNSDYGQNQRRIIETKGGIGEYAFSLGGSIRDEFYFGATFGIQRVRYESWFDHTEDDEFNNIADFDYFTYTNYLETLGTGYTFKAGAIYKPLEFVRLGAAVHLPTFYRMSDYFYSDVVSSFDPNEFGESDYYEFSSPDEAPYEYSIITPFKALGSVAFQIKKSALINVEYEFIDYSSARLRRGSDGYNFSDENEEIKEAYTSAGNLRVGAEYRIGSVYLRGGYQFYGSAFAENEDNSDASYAVYSGGIGFRHRVFYFDLAYSYTDHSEFYFLYPNNNIQATSLDSRKHQFGMTMGVKF